MYLCYNIIDGMVLFKGTAPCLHVTTLATTLNYFGLKTL